MNQPIVRQTKELGDSLPTCTSELVHLWFNMFNYFRKYICVHALKLNKLNEEENERAAIGLKIEKNTSID